MTISQVTGHGGGVYVQFGRQHVPFPGTLGSLLLTFIADGKPNTGTSSPATTYPVTPGEAADRLILTGLGHPDVK
jgi:hypothetical protein